MSKEVMESTLWRIFFHKSLFSSFSFARSDTSTCTSSSTTTSACSMPARKVPVTADKIYEYADQGFQVSSPLNIWIFFRHFALRFLLIPLSLLLGSIVPVLLLYPISETSEYDRPLLSLLWRKTGTCDLSSTNLCFWRSRLREGNGDTQQEKYCLYSLLGNRYVSVWGSSYWLWKICSLLFSFWRLVIMHNFVWYECCEALFITRALQQNKMTRNAFLGHHPSLIYQIYSFSSVLEHKNLEFFMVRYSV